MNALVMPAGFLRDSGFFAPVAPGALDGLLAEYQERRAQIEQVIGIFKGDLGGIVGFFVEGNRHKDGSRYSSLSAEKIFGRDGAIGALNSSYWSRAMALTDVYQYMPQKRRDEWNKSIHDNTAPEFVEATVKGTIRELLSSRDKFFAERVDGIFRALSGVHVTNSPEGFGKRMIIAHLINCFGTTDHSRIGYINDLRCVIAKFMGRDEPNYGASSKVVEAARLDRGQWLTVDAGALRLRAYKCGTAHIEVHPDMAWRLNAVLAHLYPQAIPSEFRTKPTRRRKDFTMMGRPLPFSVIEVLAEMDEAKEKYTSGYRDHYRPIRKTRCFSYRSGSEDKLIRTEVTKVLAAIGGVISMKGWFEFDYDPTDAIREIVCSGCIPDQQAHQFYPTPESVARAAVAMANIGVVGTILEPSAGLGALALLLPAGRLTCVEIAPLHCAVLRARGLNAVQADFIEWSDVQWRQGTRFDRIIMNPPFSEGRAQAHVEQACKLIAPDGVLVAVLPASMRGKQFISGYLANWSDIYAGEFAGTSVSVAIARLQKATR